jgi:sRNA-binding protein
MAIKRLLFSLLAMIMFSGMAVSMPATALDKPPVSVVETPTSEDNTTTDSAKTQIKNQANDLREQFKAQAQANVAEKKAQVVAKTQEQRQKACEARKANITKRMSKAVTQAEKHKATFDKIYNKVQAFKTKKDLTVENYDSLVTAADKAQSDAQASITALKDLDVSVDCTSETVAQSLASFQVAVKATRDSLKTYRESITDLIKAVKAAVPATSDSSQTETKQ